MNEASTEPKPKHRWYQYSLRSLMVVMTVLCIWLGYISNEARKQRNAVAWVEEMKGEALYWEHTGFGTWLRNPEPPGPDWLGEWIGPDYFSDVTWVKLNGTEVEDITPLKPLRELGGLILGDTQIHDISPLKEMKQLQKLALDNSNVDDISVVENFKILKKLSLGNTKVKDISPLKNLGNLRFLTLSENQISDISALTELTSLEYLDLRKTQVTDSQLNHLEGLINLKGLFLEHTDVTKDGVERLQRALPNCEIEWDGSNFPKLLPPQQMF